MLIIHMLTKIYQVHALEKIVEWHYSSVDSLEIAFNGDSLDQFDSSHHQDF